MLVGGSVKEARAASRRRQRRRRHALTGVYVGAGCSVVGGRRVRMILEMGSEERVVKKAVRDLSEKPKPVVVKKGNGKKDESLKTLIDEALDIKKQLDALSHKFHVES